MKRLALLLSVTSLMPLAIFALGLPATGASSDASIMPGGAVDDRPTAGSSSLIPDVYLPVVIVPPLQPPFDMATFMIGDGRLYEVWHSNNSQARHQTQLAGGRFYHTKGDDIEAEWEELWASDAYVYRGVDTSPGNDQYYVAYDKLYEVGAIWSPRYWDVGDLFERSTYVTFHRKSDCGLVVSGFQRSWLRFVAYYPSYTFGSGITLANVVELAWLLSATAAPTETYFYAQSYGLVGWSSDDRGHSHISEIHAPGQRPDNLREQIGCLNQSLRQLPLNPALFMEPLPAPYRAK
jgi:hypothetical protein